MVAIAIAAINFGAVRELLGPRAVEAAAFLLLGALPMANVLIVGLLIARQRPRSRPFLLGFEAFGLLSLSVYVFLLLIFGQSGPMIWYLELVFNPLTAFFRAYPPLAMEVSVCILMLVGPQLVFAMIGGFLSRSFKVTITRR
jgi:hypothetical protein